MPYLITMMDGELLGAHAVLLQEGFVLLLDKPADDTKAPQIDAFVNSTTVRSIERVEDGDLNEEEIAEQDTNPPTDPDAESVPGE